MFVFLVRHAEGLDSKDKWQTPDLPLSELGVKQAQSLTDLSRFKNIDLVLSSNWKRASETAKILSETLKKPLEIFDGIHEREQHEKIYGADRTSEISQKYGEEYLANYGNFDWKFENDEESVREVIIRASNFLDYLTKKHLSQSLLAVSHDLFIRCFITTCLLGKDYDDNIFNNICRSFQIMNSGVSLLEFSEKRNSWKVWYINDFSHLSKISKK